MCELEDEFSGPVIDALSLRRGEVLMSPLYLESCCLASMAMHPTLCLHVAGYDTCSAMRASDSRSEDRTTVTTAAHVTSIVSCEEVGLNACRIFFPI